MLLNKKAIKNKAKTKGGNNLPNHLHFSPNRCTVVLKQTV